MWWWVISPFYDFCCFQCVSHCMSSLTNNKCRFINWCFVHLLGTTSWPYSLCLDSRRLWRLSHSHSKIFDPSLWCSVLAMTELPVRLCVRLSHSVILSKRRKLSRNLYCLLRERNTLWGVYAIQQISSKLPANVFKIHVLDVCCSVNTL